MDGGGEVVAGLDRLVSRVVTAIGQSMWALILTSRFSSRSSFTRRALSSYIVIFLRLSI